MHPRMRELIAEQLTRLAARLPAGVSLGDALWDADVLDPILAEDREAAIAYAWLLGVADAEDVTVTQLVELAELDRDEQR